MYLHIELDVLLIFVISARIDVKHIIAAQTYWEKKTQ